MTVSSIAPSSIRSATTADSSRSARNFGKMRPFDTAPSSWPARPTRWRPRATDFGDSTWMTRSTAPMSMPSSSDDVATRHGIAPRLQQLLDLHALLAGERAVMGAGDLLLGQLVQTEREPLGEPAVVDEHDRRAVLLDETQELGIDRGPDRLRADLGSRVRLLPVGRRGVRERARRPGLAHVLDRDDDLAGRAPSRVPASTSWIGRPPETKRPISSSGRCVADRAIR